MRRIIKGKKITWVDIQDPAQEDVKYLGDNFDFHPLILGELIPPGSRSKVENEKGYLFMTLFFPFHHKGERETSPRELDIIVTKNTLITSHYKTILPLKAIFDKCKVYPEVRGMYMAESPGHLLFYILDAFWKNCLLKLTRIGDKIDFIEKEIFKGKEKEMVMEISLVKADIIDFWRIVEPQKETLESLSIEGIKFFGPSLSPYFYDISGSYNLALNTIKSYKEIIASLEITNQSLLSTKNNETMRILTIFSTVFLPLTLLASIWGMNIKLPFEHSSFAFFVLIFSMFSLMSGMILYFRKNKWI